MATKLFKWLMVLLIPLFSLTLTSCGDDDKDESEASTGNSTYTFSNTQHFSRQWMVSEIEKNGKVSYSFEYDANNCPIAVTRGSGIFSSEILYSYVGNICTYTNTENDGYSYSYKGYFDGNKLIKAEWDEYTITNVTYDGNHLVKGSNGYKLTWDSKGNITYYSDEGMNFTYTEIPNKTNVDFNMICESLLADCWCDDGSKYFTIFGWTGARTANLISTRLDRDGDHDEFSYILDEIGRPIEIQKIKNGGAPIKYVISYVEN